MKILTVEQLTEQGISVTEIQKSLTMTYLNKQYRRKSDLPKKFRVKVLGLCTEIENSGKQYFVTETNYSYTVWEEELVTTKANINKNDSETFIANNTSINRSLDSETNTTILEEKSKEVNLFTQSNIVISGNNNTDSSKREYNLFQYTANSNVLENIRQRKNQRQSSSSETGEEVIKYRGVAINQPITPTVTTPKTHQSVTINHKSRTYRGIAY